MDNEGDDQAESPFKDFVVHEVDGNSTSIGEGSQQEGVEEASGDAGDDAKATEEGDAEEGDAEEGDAEEGDAEEGDAEEGDAEEGDEKPKPKKKLTINQRMRKFTKAQRAAERETSTVRTELEASNTRIAELEAENKKLTGDDDPASGEDTGSSDGSEKPNPDDFTYGELDSAYVEALTAYQVALQLGKQREKDEETRQSEAAEQQAEELQTQYDERVLDGLTAYDDFEDVVIKAAEEGKYPLSREMAMLGVESPEGHHVLYQIAGDLELAKSLAQLTPVQQARQFGRLEAQFVTDDKDIPKIKKIPAARKPPTKRSGGKGAVPFDPATAKFADFEKKVNADRSRKS